MSAHAAGPARAYPARPLERGGLPPARADLLRSPSRPASPPPRRDAKLSPVFVLHDGPPASPPERGPIEGILDGVTTRLWRIDDPAAIAASWQRSRAARHRRRPPPLRRGPSLPRGGGERRDRLRAGGAGLCRDEPGLTIFPTHRLVAGAMPALNGDFVLSGGAGARGRARPLLEAAPRSSGVRVPAPRGEVPRRATRGGEDPLDRLDVAEVDRLGLGGVTFTPSRRGRGCGRDRPRAAPCSSGPRPWTRSSRSPGAGRTMPEKSTYFFPKLISGLVFSPFDE